MARIFFIIFTLSCTAIFAGLYHDPSFKERLKKARKGDYVVTEANKMITVLSIQSHTPFSIILEEISAPVQNLKNRPASWAEWVKNKAPGHTAWSMIEINLSDNELMECYSFSRAAWLQISSQESILSTLLHLPLEKVPPEKRKKIGPPPLAEETDHRQVWNPTLIFEGKKIEKTDFNVYETKWPKDHSELSGKTVALYFDQDGNFPLPYWIQVEAAHATATMRVIDSGRNLPSPYQKLPRRIPEFIGTPQLNENGLQLSLKSPKYYRTFELYAVDITTKDKHILPITYSLITTQGETVKLQIAEEELVQVLEPGHRYTWLLIPAGYGELYTELTKPFHWNPKYTP
jgi:hypothetical protein